MDLYKKTLFDRIDKLTRKGEVDAFEYSLLLREALKYKPSDEFMLTELGSVLFHSGMLWEAHVILDRAWKLHGVPKANDLLKRIESPALPVQCSIETSTVCSLACPLCLCGSGLSERKGRTMSFEDFKTVWEKISPTVRRLHLTGQGEFFEHEHAYDILDLVKGTEAVFVDTHGNVELDPDRLLAGGLTEIVFSLDGIDQASYEKYRMGGSFDRVTDNIRNLVRARNARGLVRPKIAVQFLLFKHTEMYETEAEELARSLGVDRFLPEPPSFRPAFGKKLYDEFMPLADRNQALEWIDFSRDELGRAPERDSSHCLTALRHLAVDVDGRAFACPGAERKDAAPYGDLLTQSLEDVWNGRAAAEFRMKVFRDRESVSACRLCSASLVDNSRFFQGTENEETPRRKDVSTRFYTRTNRVATEEISRLRQSGRTREAEYFLSLGKADDPDRAADGILDVLEQLKTGAVDYEAARRDAETARKINPPSSADSDETDMLANDAPPAPNAAEFNRRAFEAFKTGNLNRAFELLEDGLKVDPLYRDLILNLCRLREQTGGLDLVQAQLRVYMEKNPGDAAIGKFLRDVPVPSAN